MTADELTEMTREALGHYMDVKATTPPNDDGTPGDAVPTIYVTNAAGVNTIAAVMSGDVFPTDVLAETIVTLDIEMGPLVAAVWLTDALGKATPIDKIKDTPIKRGTFAAARNADPAGSGVFECLMANGRTATGHATLATVFYTRDETGAVVYEDIQFVAGPPIGDVPRMLDYGFTIAKIMRANAANN